MKRLIIVLASLALAVACTTTMPERETPQQRIPVGPKLTGDGGDEIIMTGAEEVTDDGIVEVELYEGSGSFINEKAARRKASVVSEDGEIVLNFEGESLQSVVHTILGEVLQETFVIGPGVSGQVTFSTSKPVTREQLMPILELLLRWNGATLVYSQGRYHVLPVSEAIRGHLVPRLGGAESARGYEVRVVPLRYISPTEMAKILEPYVRDNAIVSVDVARSMIFLAGTREELGNYLQTVKIFDVDWLAGMSVGIYPLLSVDVASITTELTAVFGMEADSPLAGLFRFVPLERLGSVMVITPKEEYLEKARVWIERLDRGAAGAGTQLFVYRVKNLEATVLANYLTQLFGGTIQGSRRQDRTNLAPGLQPVTMGSVSSFNQNRQAAIVRGTEGGTGRVGAGGTIIASEQGDIRITSVLETNSLLIQATQSQYANLLAAIERIDEEPLQVLIESQVMDVVLNENLEFGVSWYLTNNPDLIPPQAGNPANRYIDTVAFGEPSNLSGGFNLLSTITNPLGSTTFVQAVISALDNVSDVRAIAAPSLLVRNNAQATITVGTQVPVQSSSIATGSDTVISSAQYVSTGVTLTVTPRINPGGLVYMDVSQEVSRPGTPDVAGGNPPIDNKNVSSQVAVQSGQTIFLGGLITEQETQTRSGVPYLNRIPGIGRLFGSTTTNKNRSETIVMITPTVIESSADLRLVSEDIRDEFLKIPPIEVSTLQD